MTPVNSHLFLDPEQQDLLMAALASNNPIYLTDNSQHQYTQSLDSINDFGAGSKLTHDQSLSGVPGSIQSPGDMDITRSSSVMGFTSPLNEMNSISPAMDNLDYNFDLDGSYDYDFGMDQEYKTVNGGLDHPNVVENEKRKTPPTDNENGTPSNDPHDAEPKRREKDTEEKVAKKPGRKPLTSEPTSKRKAQNRAAQRAFRERKEKHLRDLEEKVSDLEKQSEATNKENSALRQQIARLQAELNEYRKRVNETKSISSILGKGTTGGFHFEFPTFGTRSLGFTNNVKPTNGTSNDLRVGPGTLVGRARSSTTPSSSQSGHAAPTTSGTNLFNDTPQTAQDHPTTSTTNYYTPSVGASSLREHSVDYLTDTNNQKDSPMSNRADSTTSPSSSVSQHGTSSSVTSPESSSHSPLTYKDQLEPVTEEIVPVISSEHDEPEFHCGVLDDGETSFCEKLGAIACGNPRNPAPLSPDSKLLPNLNEVIPRPDPASIARRNSNNFSALAAQNGGAFDPVLFNGYRDPMNQANLDLNMSFFDDAFPMVDFSLGSPLPGTPAAEKTEVEMKKPCPGLNDQDDDLSSSDDEEIVVTAGADANLMSCNKIWDRISSHPKFVSGELDMDNLCAELRSKAKCSETGVVVGQKDVEAVLSKAGLKCPSTVSAK